MADVRGASLQPIYNQLNSAPAYHPLEADTFADWSLEAGDIVTVTRDNKGYASPVHSSVVSWRKQPQVTISSTGNESRESISKISQKKYRGGSGSLRNSQYLHYYVEDQYKQMRSGLELTTSSASLYVQDAYKQLKAGLDLTSSSASLYVEDKYNQMKSGLDLTSSSAYLYVQDAYKQLQSGLKLTSSSAALYVQSKTKKAELLLSITDGKSNAKLTADTIDIHGVVQQLIGEDIAARGFVAGETLDLYEGCEVIARNDTAVYVRDDVCLVKNGTYYNMDNCIVDASKSGNTLTLTRLDGSKLTFSRATQLSGTWSGSGKLTVTADDSSVPSYVRLLVAKPASEGYVPIYAQWGSSGQYEEDTGFRVSVPGAPTDLGIYDTNGQIVTSQTISEAIDLWAGYKNGSGTMEWGSKVTITPSGGSHSPIIDNVWTTQSTQSGWERLNSLKTQYELAKADGDFFCVRVKCGGQTKTYYCEP